MIEKLLKKELAKKRWRRFKARKTALWSSYILIIMTILSFSAEILSNSKPLYLNYNNKSYFPIFFVYPPSDFGQTESLYVNYRKIEIGEKDSIIWPVNKWDPYESNEKVEYYPSKPTGTNLMGTDVSGRDVFARIIYGFRYSIMYAVGVWFFSFIIGTILGGMMGYFGGIFDIIMQRIVEVISSIPMLFILLILIMQYQPNMFLLILITTFFGWIGISYYARAEFLKNRKQEYVEAARGMGASTSRIIFKHILPNSMTPAITFAPFVISAHITGLASLDYLGFGLPVPTPSWGELLNQAQKNFTTAWWLAVFPILAFFITLTLLNLVGEGVRDALDPKKI